MTQQYFDSNVFISMPIIGIVRGISPDSLNALLPLFIDSGFSCIEITMNTIGASDMISNAIKKHGTHLCVGAGTVCSLNDLETALHAGANFIVTPLVVKDVIKECVRLGVPVFPGAFSPTEIFEAWSLGATMVKVFPASTFGSDYIRSIKAPFPQIKLMPTGGITSKDLLRYTKSGADAFGIGSPLFPDDMINKNEWNDLGVHLKEFKKAWEESIS